MILLGFDLNLNYLSQVRLWILFEYFDHFLWPVILVVVSKILNVLFRNRLPAHGNIPAWDNVGLSLAEMFFLLIHRFLMELNGKVSTSAFHWRECEAYFLTLKHTKY